MAALSPEAKEKHRLSTISHYHRNSARLKVQMKEYRTRIKDAVFGAYGGYKCACCGELEKIFLTIDHINNDGAAHRKQIGFRGGIGLYLWIAKHDFPPGFQVYCFNCNHGKQLNHGVCPHKGKEPDNE